MFKNVIGFLCVGAGVILGNMFVNFQTVSAQDVWAYQSGTCDGYVMTETIKPSNLGGKSACAFEVTTKYVPPDGKYKRYIWNFSYDEGEWWYSMRDLNVPKHRGVSPSRVDVNEASGAVLNIIAEYSDFEPADW